MMGYDLSLIKDISENVSIGNNVRILSFSHLEGVKIENNVNVNLYTNSSTIDPKINGLGFFQFYNNIFCKFLIPVRSQN